MVRITKTMQAKHVESMSPFVKEFRNAACTVPLPLLPQHLTTFPSRWPFPRGDLYHWIPLLNRFDDVLDKFCDTYKLEDPQTSDFGCEILQSGISETEVTAPTGHDLKGLGFSTEGDRELVESILQFSKMLLQNCGNRSVYASSSHLSKFLNSTSLSLLEVTLELGSELAQRYQAALKRMNIPVRNVSNALLANHYNINLDRVLQLALPFSKSVTSPAEAVQPVTPATPATPSAKGKEKAIFNMPAQKGATTTVYASELVSIVNGGSAVGSSPKSVRNGASSLPATETGWEEWGDVKILFYPKTNVEPDTSGNSSTPAPAPYTPSGMPATPTPSRRSNLGPGSTRSDRQSTSDESPSPLPRASTFPALNNEDTARPNFKVIQISSSKIKSNGLHALLREHMSDLPVDQKYELLTKLRVANALITSVETRRQMLAVRLLAITNLAYIHSEPVFLETVLKQDSEEPRRLQLIYQLAELIHPPTEGEVAVPRGIQTLAFALLDAMASLQSKFSDVCAALNTNVNHGVLLYVVRKAVAEMSKDDDESQRTEDDVWRGYLFALVANLSVNPRTGSDLVTAGLIPILVEVLALRTPIAKLYQPQILSFLDTIMYSAREAFTALVGADGLDAVSSLIVHEVGIASDSAAAGNGMPPQYRSSLVDYSIPFYDQQILKWLFKFIHHMMSTAGGYGGNFDRLLRNLIDSSQLLGSLRQIIGNAHLYGSTVWTNAVSILNDFINNEPTSFAVIAEAGLSRGLLEAVTGTTIVMPVELKKSEHGAAASSEESTTSTVAAAAGSPNSSSDEDEDEDELSEQPEYTVAPLTVAMLQTPREGQLARGILPNSETINIVPQAFSAICLNNAGMKMFQASKALEIFFEIFESPEHVKCMESNKDLPGNLGSSFDELVRHHPPLKDAILQSIVNMVARVDYLCKIKAESSKIGAKLWTTDISGKPVVADDQLSLSLVDHSIKGKRKAVDDSGDVEMQDADSSSDAALLVQSSSPDINSTESMTPYITAVATFLSSMFGNTVARTEFCNKGGLEHILNLAHSPCLSYDFGDSSACRTFHHVISQLADAKPHLVMPSLLKRAQNAADDLQPFIANDRGKFFFAPFINEEARQAVGAETLSQGTKFAKALVNLHSLIPIINSCFQPPSYNHRVNTNFFVQVNVADYYIRFVNTLGPLMGATFIEDMRLRKAVPESWQNSSRVKDSGFGESSADVSAASESSTATSAEALPPTSIVGASNGDLPESAEGKAPSTPDKSSKTVSKTEQSSPSFKNYLTLRYLLGQMTRVITPFFQTLGKALVTKRTPDNFQKQGHLAMADALVQSILSQLSPSENECSEEKFTYWIGFLHCLRDMLIERKQASVIEQFRTDYRLDQRHGDRPIQILTIVLQAFKERGGMDTLNHMLDVLTSEIRKVPQQPQRPDLREKKTEDLLLYDLAIVGTTHILSLYREIVNGRNLTESNQTMSMLARAERERRLDIPDVFSPPQLLVDLRMAVLPAVRKLWGSNELIEKGTSQISEKLIEVIRTIAVADHEANAHKRGDALTVPGKHVHKAFKLNSEYQTALGADMIGAGNSDLADEALYRCNNNLTNAMEYCRMVATNSLQRHPVPVGDIVSRTLEANPASHPQTSDTTGTATPEDQTMVGSVMDIVGRLNDIVTPAAATPTSEAGSIDQALAQVVNNYANRAADSTATPSASTPTVSSASKPPPKVEALSKRVTVDDLNEERALIRDNLIDKCLDVINAHGDVTHEISDLITTVVNKSEDPATQRKVVSETLVIALMSFAGEEDLRVTGKKVAAYANLLALMLRDKLFYAAAVEELKENLGTLLTFIKLSPNHSAEERSPWVPQILLIVEMLLSEDARPQKTKWTLPKDENDIPEPPVLQVIEPSVGEEERAQLLEAVLDILIRVNKDEGLALAVLRILIILSRTRSIAQRIGEKKNIQRLFVMAKQLAGASSTTIQGPLLIILRHIIEDAETIKQIMRAEIKTFMETNRQTRNIDEKTYLRGLSHTALRSPELFVEATNEMVKFSRWVYQPHDGRLSSLVLKDRTTEPAPKDDSVQPTVQATEDLSIQDVKTSTEAADTEMTDVVKPTTHEQKLPVVENPDGVIHFLLCELLNYRDVEDKDKESAPVATSIESSSSRNDDTTNLSTSSESGSASAKDKPKSSSKQDFKAEEHPIYIYRCFILQCLTELLSSYNRTKIEFINFKRSAPPQSMTPSKPRSSVVNYLLYDLIPLGTLDHAENTTLRKKLVTSNWADSVLTALLCKTGEQPADKSREPYDSENEPDLLFVRRFVLENILKAYSQASASTETLDVKYARMLALADLMNHIMSGKENVGPTDTSVANMSQKQLRRIMFEKGYVAALTASIADVDLNFPGAKRAVKYILRPLKTLTTTAVQLSDLALISATTGQGDEDEIESATSLSEPEEDREETPDLFRNSTLGMLEYGREEDSSTESDDEDEEMYEGEYEDEMEYDDEHEPGDDEDNISDEDEEIEGMGPIEGVDGDHGLDVEVIMADDDDDDEDDTSSDDDDSEDNDGHADIIDEAGDIQQIAEDEMDEWESDDQDDDGEEEDYEGQAADAEEQQLHDMEMGGPIGHLVRALGGGDVDAAQIIERMEAEGMDPEDDEDDERIPGEYVEDEDEEGDEDDEDEMDDEMLFDQYPLDGPGAASFGWQDEVEPPMIAHRRPRGVFSPFPLEAFAGGPRDPLGVSEYRPTYRSHRPGAPAPRGPGDDGLNPLLQRSSAGGPSPHGSSRVPSMGSFIQAMSGAGGEILDIGGRPFGESPAAAALLDEVIRFLPPMPGHIARHGPGLQFHITAAPGQPLPPHLQAMFSMRPPRTDRHPHSTEPGGAAFFTPQSTTARWLEEARIVFGAATLECSADLASAILALLVPPAIELDKAAKVAEAEKARKVAEEIKKQLEEEKIAKEKKAEEERIEKEKKEAEEREEAERVAAEALAARGPEAEATDNQAPAETQDVDAMDGVESEVPAQAAPAEQAEDAPAADRPRITTMIRGNPYDITDLGVDAEFLAELPDDIREEVIMSAVAERRSTATAAGANPTDIDQDFLDALPDDIRDEIIQQERQDRRRREREERNRAAAAANGGAVAGGDMDVATILATLPPALRNQVLMEQDDATLAQFPPEIAAQARSILRQQAAEQADRRGAAGHRGVPPPAESRQPNAERPQRRAIVQILDKSGIATLLRLMFIFQHGSLRSTLNSVLQNISLNRHNRNEVISTLLHILQDGSVDMTAVERSFAHLSLRAKQPKDIQSKTPQSQSLKRALTNVGPITQTTFEASPLMVVQQCLAALVSLNQVNPHIPAFFLTEHSTIDGLKRSLSRKGKGKENKAAKFALNSLLSLLGRNLIMESSSVMESLSTLLNMITSPLQGLQRKQKEAEEAKKKVAEAAEAAEAAPSVASPENTTTTTEQTGEVQADVPISDVSTAVEVTQVQTEDGGASASTSPAAQEPKPDAAKQGEKTKEKKMTIFTPPVIPEHNLKLVINIFVARECSSKTFRETLSTIKNLSTIPNAKAVFGRELISKAQGLGEIILVDLEELLPQIEKATTGTEIQGVALAKFSPGGSDQNKLLRVLTALDHLFDPKRDKKDKLTDAEVEGESSQLVEKQDLLSSLYKNPTFGRMWERLSACLSAIRQREHMLNVATILLPLIEALMVVCKNTTLKDAPISRTQHGKDMLLTSPPPESQMESLFYTFTEEHRKILNDLVRHTPKLMSGTFSLLVKNPKVLEFDNKRNYFSRSIHAKAPNARQSFAPLQLSVRRDQVFHDSFKSLYFQTGDQMKYGKLSIRFHGEEGVDAGGVTREWFQVLSRQMFDPGYALFVPVSSDRTTFHPNHSSGINEEHLMFFKFIGRIIGKALYEGRVLDCHFSRAVYKRILGKAVSVKDMESLDLDYYKSLIWMLENDITDIITETFSTEQERFGVTETVDFIPNGRNIPVTEENKQEYVRLMTEFRLTGSVKEQLDEFLKGFHDIIPASLVAIFNEQELELLISGLPEIEVDDWKSNTEYHNYTASSPQIQWFWRAVRSYDKEERAKLLQFVTGTSKVPLNGFKELEGMNGFSRFNIHRDYGSKERLPSSHTCFNQLDLPEYESYETLRKQVLTAITAGSEYFGFA
ncbi:related to TOM1 protein [Rhynchosporium secalis]|uniref:HECT-type E3 ubiquitin transferase n=1 Tax=Rhynchosporium secalis TaxID=38038 RepID=A0A1E1M4B6_RHYSE|nr:related to TOM1 protein [Rhynchosporium secalis]